MASLQASLRELVQRSGAFRLPAAPAAAPEVEAEAEAEEELSEAPRPSAETPASPDEPRQVTHDIAFSAILKVGGAIVGVWLLAKSFSVLVLLALAIMLAVTLNPLVRRLQVRLNRSWAIGTVVLGIVTFGLLFIGLVIPPLVRQAQSLLSHLPDYAASMEEMAHVHSIPLKLSPIPKSVVDQLGAVGPQLLNVVTTVLSGVVGVATVAVLTIYLLVDGPRVYKDLIRLAPRHDRLPIRRLGETLARQVGGYLRGQLVVSALAGCFSFVLLLACRVPEPLALAFLVAVSDAVPVVGLITALAALIMMSLTKSLPTALLVGGLYFVYHEVEVNLIMPRVYSTAMKLAPLVILLAILIGATLMGVLGMLLALPVAAAVPVVYRFLTDWRERKSERTGRLGPA